MALRALCLLLLAWAAAANAQAPFATATIVDGSPTLLRASSKSTLVEGSRLAAADIVETGSARHLRIEFADGLMLDLDRNGRAVGLSPGHAALISSDTSRPAAYVVAADEETWIAMETVRCVQGLRS